MKEESTYPKWQEESLINEEITSQKGYADTKLLKDGCKINLLDWAKETIDEIIQLNNTLDLNFDDVLQDVKERIDNPENTYSKKLLKIIEKEGFINSQLRISKENKQHSLNINLKEKYPQYYDEYIKLALPRK